MTTPRKVAGARLLITGAASGLGTLLAIELASRGVTRLALWDHDAVGLERVAGQLELLGAQPWPYRVELTDATNIIEVGELMLTQLGGIDICVNCAGVVSGQEFTQLTDEQLVRTFQVNALAPFRVTRVVLPGMLARDRGVVVNIASAAALAGVAKLSDYSASKFAVAGFTESLRAELRNRGSALRTLAVYPHYIDTGMFAGVRTRVPALLPILDRHRVAHRIVNAIESGRQQLFLPDLVTVVLALRMLPAPVFDAVLDRLGVHRAMAGFKGRQPV